MSITRFAEQTFPSLLSEACEHYTPAATHLFPVVVITRLSQKEINRALYGRKAEPAKSGQPQAAGGVPLQDAVALSTALQEKLSLESGGAEAGCAAQ